MLLSLSGQTHQVMTAVAITHQNTTQVLTNQTRVRFRDISSEEAEAYWETGEPTDKAGGYGIQGYGGVFVEEIQGSYSSVVGLPLYETQVLLKQFNIPVWSN